MFLVLYDISLTSLYPVSTQSILTDRSDEKSVDPDQTPQNVASDLGLHFLPLIQQVDTSKGSQIDLIKF